MLFGNSTNPIDEIRTIFHQHEDPVAAAQEWATTLLQEANIDPAKQPMAAIKKIREQEKAFSLKGATYLFETLSS